MVKKEGLIIILDVRQNVNKEFKRKSIQCVADILKDKICSGKKDYVSFVLFGTQQTLNNSSGHSSSENYTNIVQYPKVVVPSWSILVDFMKFVSQPACDDGDWLGALVIALGIAGSDTYNLKYCRKRFLLFHDFDAPSTFYGSFNVITTNILHLEAQLIVVNIQYIDCSETGEPQAVFRSSTNKPKFQLKSEKYALQLVSACNAKLYNFQEAFRNVFFTDDKTPFCWYTQFVFGSKIRINISVGLAIKDNSTIKLARVYGEHGEEIQSVSKYYVKGEEVQPEDSDLIEGYMLGSTPVPIDEPMKLPGDGNLTRSLKCIGFVKNDSVPREDHQGDTVHMVVHQRGMKTSAKMLDAFVKALLKTQMCVLCWKIYSIKFNPKLVVLRPNEIKDDRPATLSMFELVYPAQHLYWDFPKLRTKKNECTKEQLDAMDSLIDSMDLMLEPDSKQQTPTREMRTKDLLPYDTLPHIYEKCLLDMLERKVLKAVGKEDPYIEELVAEKNYKDTYLRVPEAIEEQAKQAAAKVKKLIPLKRNVFPIVRNTNLKSTIGQNDKNMEEKQNVEDGMKEAESETNSEKVECVGLNTPAEDFEKLLKHEVLTVEDCTLRDVKFQNIAGQMRDRIWQLLFFSATPTADQMNRVAEALKVFRRCSFDFNAFADYNDWMHKLKAQIVADRLFDFWTNYVVKQELGLCFVDVPSLEERLKQDAFYEIDADLSMDKLEITEQLPSDDEHMYLKSKLL